jgi:HEAT repeat protein
VALLLLAAAVVLSWPALQVRLWISSLHSDDPAAIQAAERGLTQSGRQGVNDALFGVLVDPGASFAVRVRTGRILLDRIQGVDRVGEAVLRPDLTERTAALAALGERDYFQRYVDDERFRVRETVLDWLRRDDDLTRTAAIELAKKMALEEASPLIRPLIRVTHPATRSTQEAALVREAMRAVDALEDCEAVPLLRTVAETEPSDDVRWVALDLLERVTRGRDAPCPDGVTDDVLRDLVLAALDGGRTTSLTAMRILRDHPPWAPAGAARLWAILDGPADGTVRRTALSALPMAARDELAQRLPRYFHDPDPSVRSEAATAAGVYEADPEKPARFVSCWIGMLRDETQNEVGWKRALEGLHGAAKGWRGLPDDLASLPGDDPAAFLKMRQELFSRGESRGLSRLAWAEGWLRWWAASLGLATDEVDAAVEVHRAFWRAAERGDAAEARRVLGTAPEAPGLFCYEEGWLARHGRG